MTNYGKNAISPAVAGPINVRLGNRKLAQANNSNFISFTRPGVKDFDITMFGSQMDMWVTT